ncbi:uncharacterized protein DUF2169 [Rhodobacter viridis]|uniref:Uncharacterized protein DUF2169 n=1 Tax=Rhodobacter viridis TaxID=1054202 RepID=A0A318U757_9RHOB|nr:uncharacterized protein DUF2169 [Rhodobacter viridis]
MTEFERLQPVGFGPVDRWRPARAALAGTCGPEWEAIRAPLPPADYDPHFQLSAPRDQWIAPVLHGGEEVAIAGTGPMPIGRFRLPQIVPAAVVTFRGRRQTLHFRLSRVDLDLDLRSVSMLYLATLPCGPFETDIEKTVLRLHQIAGVAR